MKQTTTPTTKRDYKVSAATAAICDAIITMQEAYDTITEALALRYGDVEKAEEYAVKYNDAITNIIDMLHNEIKGQLIDNLGDMRNTNTDTPII